MELLSVYAKYFYESTKTQNMFIKRKKTINNFWKEKQKRNSNFDDFSKRLNDVFCNLALNII